jgi:hypothetical protein
MVKTIKKPINAINRVRNTRSRFLGLYKKSEKKYDATGKKIIVEYINGIPLLNNPDKKITPFNKKTTKI